MFSYWRTVEPEACFDRIVEALRGLADQAAAHNVIIGLENEHACNIATAAETAQVLAALDHPNLKVVWDPANAVVSGEKAVPGRLSACCRFRGSSTCMRRTARWTATSRSGATIGEGVVGWREQVDAAGARWI